MDDMNGLRSASYRVKRRSASDRCCRIFDGVIRCGPDGTRQEHRSTETSASQIKQRFGQLEIGRWYEQDQSFQIDGAVRLVVLERMISHFGTVDFWSEDDERVLFLCPRTGGVLDYALFLFEGLNLATQSFNFIPPYSRSSLVVAYHIAFVIYLL